MAEMKREVAGEIQAQLVPPPQQNVWGEALKSVIQADSTIQSAKLTSEQELEQNRQMNEGLESQLQAQEANNKRVKEAALLAKTAGTEDDATALDEMDTREVSEIRSTMKRNQDGVHQGATTHTESLINQELILKRAIQRRPWLKDEFIKASTGYLKMDVYQRGYMALAENEASRLAGADAAAKKEAEANESFGKNVRTSGWIDAMIAANPLDTQMHQQLNAIRHDDAGLAQYYKNSIGTPQGEYARNLQQTMEGTSAAAKLAKSSMEVGDAKTTETVKSVNMEFSSSFSSVNQKMFTDESMWDETGTIRPEKEAQFRTSMEAQLLSIDSYEQSLVARGASPESAAAYGNVYRANIERLIAMGSGATGTKLTKSALERRDGQAAMAARMSPAAASVGMMIMERYKITDPVVAQNIAFSMIGASNSTNGSSVVIKTLEGPQAAQVSTMLKQAMANVQDPALSMPEKNMSKDVLKNLAQGTVLNLSVVDSVALAKSYSAVGQAKLQLEDFSRAVLATENVGDEKNKPIFFDSLGEADQRNIGGAFAKSIYKVQKALVNKTALHEDLAAFRKNNEDGSSVLRWKPDGSIEVRDEAQFRAGNTAERAYLQEIKTHNAFIQRIRAQDIITNALGRPPTLEDRNTALGTNFGVVGIAGVNGTAVTASRTAVFGQDQGGAGKKPQGAEAPKEAPIGIRNNNPGNLRTGKGGAFGSYSSMREGIKAAEDNLMAYQRKHGINTIKAAIARWAPREDNNDTDAYINHVVRATGIPKDQPVDFTDKDVRKSVLMAMFEMENGPKWKTYWQ